MIFIKNKFIELSIVAKTTIAIVLTSVVILAITAILFFEAQKDAINGVLNIVKKNTLELIETNKNEKLELIKKNVAFNIEIMSSLASPMLYNIDNLALENSLMPFMDISEIMAIEVMDNLSKNQFVLIWKEENKIQNNTKEKGKKYFEALPSFERDIIFNKKNIGKIKVFYSENEVLHKIEGVQNKFLDEIYILEYSINEEINMTVLYQVFGFFLILAILIFVVITSLKKLEIKVKERTKDLEDKNKEVQLALNELKNTQQQLVESEKMAALGGLVAGVAHEINTPVGIGITAASHLEEKTRDFLIIYQDNKMKRSDLEKFLDTASQSSKIIFTNLNRAAELIQSFKQVAVDQSCESKRNFKIKEYLQEILISLRPKLKKTKIQTLIECNDSLELNTFAGAFSQIITNLIMNSIIHAFDEDSNGEILINISEYEQKVILKYSDNGKGISEENLKKIFDPFFTTKRGQGGSGLGLHIIYNIVTQKMNGIIVCKSKLNEGTTFIVEIPKNIG